MYYIKNGLHQRWHWLGFLFALFGALAGFGLANTVQSNSVSQVLAKSLKSAQSLRNLVTRAEVIAALLPFLQEKQQDEVLSALIRAIRKLREGDKRGAAWAEIAAFLPESEHKRAFADVLAVKNKRIRAEALEKYAPTLTKERDKRAAGALT